MLDGMMGQQHRRSLGWILGAALLLPACHERRSLTSYVRLSAAELNTACIEDAAIKWSMASGGYASYYKPSGTWAGAALQEDPRRAARLDVECRAALCDLTVIAESNNRIKLACESMYIPRWNRTQEQDDRLWKSIDAGQRDLLTAILRDCFPAVSPTSIQCSGSREANPLLRCDSGSPASPPAKF